MKNLLLLTILSFNFSILIAQTVFAPSGAKWTYGFNYSYEGALRDGYETIAYVGDTIIDNIEMKVLARNSFVKTAMTTVVSTFEGNYIIYQEDEKVFDKSGNLLYDFLLEIGDTVSNVPSFNEEAKLIIIDKYNIEVNGFSTVEYKSKIDCGTGPAPEDSIIVFNSIIAAQGYFLLAYNHCVWDITPNYHLRCYEDDTVGFYQISEEDCEQINYVLSNHEVDGNLKIDIEIYPNPIINKQFRIETTYNLINAEVWIYNAIGQLQAKHDFSNNQQILKVPHEGLFYISIFSEGKRIVTKTVVAE